MVPVLLKTFKTLFIFKIVFSHDLELMENKSFFLHTSSFLYFCHKKAVRLIKNTMPFISNKKVGRCLKLNIYCFNNPEIA